MEISIDDYFDMGQGNEFEFLDSLLDEVERDGNDVAISQQDNTLLFPVPMVNPGRERERETGRERETDRQTFVLCFMEAYIELHIYTHRIIRKFSFIQKKWNH